MLNILLTGILAANILLIVLVFAALVSVKRKFYEVSAAYDEIRNQVVDFVKPVSDGEPSKLAQTIDAVGVSFSRSMAAQLKTTFMGVQSAASRNQKALEADFAQDMLGSQAPALAQLLSAFPAVQKRLRKNPGLIDMAMGILPNVLGKGKSNGSETQGNNHSQSVPFKL